MGPMGLNHVRGEDEAGATVHSTVVPLTVINKDPLVVS